MLTIEVTQQSHKPYKTSSYACHIYGLNGHKMTDYHKLTKMKRMFHGKFMIVAKVQPIAKIKTITTNVNVVDVNVTIRNKAIKEHVFKDREPRKT
jgi:hypothetical protein